VLPPPLLLLLLLLLGALRIGLVAWVVPGTLKAVHQSGRGQLL
jgi:hypothetical protein